MKCRSPLGGCRGEASFQSWLGSRSCLARRNDMALSRPVRRIAIVGTGVIGASWAAEFLAKGFDVIATDPAPNAEANLRKYVDAAWPALTAMGLAADASRDRLTFTLDMKKA